MLESALDIESFGTGSTGSVSEIVVSPDTGIEVLLTAGRSIGNASATAVSELGADTEMIGSVVMLSVDVTPFLESSMAGETSGSGNEEGTA